jgi:hypothetical protein
MPAQPFRLMQQDNMGISHPEIIKVTGHLLPYLRWNPKNRSRLLFTEALKTAWMAI